MAAERAKPERIRWRRALGCAHRAVEIFCCVLSASIWAGWQWRAYKKAHRFDTLDQPSRLSTLVSEEAFYYSYYDDIVQNRGMSSIMFDSRSEHPDVINALGRFNIYQEIWVGYLRNLLLRCGVVSAMEPFQFILVIIFALSGLHLVGLMLISQRIAGKGLCGLFSTFAVAIWMGGMLIVSTRVWVLPEERENWALPFLTMRTFFLVKHLSAAPPDVAVGNAHASLLSRHRSLIGSTVIFLLFWQFSPFVMLVQTMAMWCCFRMHTMSAHELRQFLTADLFSYVTSMAILCGNTVYTTSFYLPFCVAVYSSSFLPPASLPILWRPGAPTALLCAVKRLLHFIFAGIAAAGVLLVVGAAVKICSSIGLALIMSSNDVDDDHIFALLKVT